MLLVKVQHKMHKTFFFLQEPYTKQKGQQLFRSGEIRVSFLIFSSIERRGSVAVSKDAELDEDGDVFGHCAEGADEPGQVGHNVLSFLGVEADLFGEGRG